MFSVEDDFARVVEVFSDADHAVGITRQKHVLADIAWFGLDVVLECANGLIGFIDFSDGVPYANHNN